MINLSRQQTMLLLSSLRNILIAVSITSLTRSASCMELEDAQNLANSSIPLSFTYLFTANLSLGQREQPIPIAGGFRVPQPILNGTVYGPAINGTLDYSLSTPTILSNGTVELPLINAVGTSDDGQSLYVYVKGVGSPSSQVNQIVSQLFVLRLPVNPGTGC